ncbi:MAG TPA: hypothetical protein DET40_09050 [Lentisphaeria bacterium]|nr:MAG: hypothetical protein A2X45_19730 [Lentisphaerae bacterium GWF2_50_93]HCE43683.1 hypothetical protein [Lentisphaeria bacterium]
MNKHFKNCLIASFSFIAFAVLSQDKDFSGDFNKGKVSKPENKNAEDGKPFESDKNDVKKDKTEPEKKSEPVTQGLSDDEAYEDLTKAIRIGNSDRADAILTAYPKILNKKDKFGNTPLYNAIFANQYLVVEVLLKRKADIKLANVNGDAPVHRAAQTGNVKIIELLLKSGAAVWTANAKGESPLAKAAYSGQLEAVRFLLENKAEINTPDSKGDTPLHKAAAKGEKEIVKYLLDKGADVNSKNKEGQKPADMAKKPEVKELF